MKEALYKLVSLMKSPAHPLRLLFTILFGAMALGAVKIIRSEFEIVKSILHSCERVRTFKNISNGTVLCTPLSTDFQFVKSSLDKTLVK